MLNMKNVKFENENNFFKAVEIIKEAENSPIILLSTSEVARKFFIQELSAALFQKYNMQLHNTTPDVVINRLIQSVVEKDVNLSKWKEYMNKGQALCIDEIALFNNRKQVQQEVWCVLRDFSKPLILGMRDNIPKEDNGFISQLIELIERGKVIELVLENEIVSIKEI